MSWLLFRRHICKGRLDCIGSQSFCTHTICVASVQAIWDVSTGKALSGSPAANDFLYAVRFFNTTSEGLATAGKFNLTIWGFDSAGKLVPHTVQTGQLRRIFTSIAIDDTDAYMYCATSSGDVVQVRAALGMTNVPLLLQLMPQEESAHADIMVVARPVLGPCASPGKKTCAMCLICREQAGCRV